MKHRLSDVGFGARAVSRLELMNKKIIICSGSGGVGKTTTSAAIALQAASEGRKVIVLTIDPAKRLASAMGLSSLSNDPKKIEIPGLPGSKGQLYAMMLDTKRTFDRLIERYTKDPKARESIFKNRLYQHMSSMIAGSQEYMAMEKLYELYHEGDYDLLVLDTPPTRHALDFLEAPQKMINLTGNSALKWFLKPGLFIGKVGLMGMKPLEKGLEKILSAFDRLAGFGFLHELSEMISLVSNLLGGFHDRAQAVYELLREDFVGFILITSPASVSLQDALYFHQKIKEAKLPFLGFLINRFHKPLAENTEATDFSNLSPSLSHKLHELIKNYEDLSHRDEGALSILNKMCERGVFCSTIPLFDADVHDIQGLRRMNEALFA